jgi:hypothetical protein
VVQLVGADVWGPKTLNVTVPVAPLVAPDSVALIELAAIAVLVASVAGAATLVAVSVTVLVKAVAAVHDEL